MKNPKIGFLGAGNMTKAIVSAMVNSKTVGQSEIFLSDTNDKKLKRVSEDLGVTSFATNEQLIDFCGVVFLAVKPQDLFICIEPIAMSFRPEQIVYSLAAGIPIDRLKKTLLTVQNLVRLMPNTAARIQRSVIGYCLMNPSQLVEDLTIKLLSPLGLLLPVNEGDQMEGLTVACSSGTGFVFELMKYWQDWLCDYGFDDETARKMIVETFLGAAMLAQREPNFSLNELQEQVVSKKGVTWAGLESFRENELERQLRIGFEKAVERERQLGNIDYSDAQKSRA